MNDNKADVLIILGAFFMVTLIIVILVLPSSLGSRGCLRRCTQEIPEECQKDTVCFLPAQKNCTDMCTPKEHKDD